MTNLDRSAVGKRLKVLRKLRSNKRQAEWAEDAGFNTHTYSSWEQGRALPPPEVGYELARLFGISLDYLYTGETQDTGKLTDNEERLLKAYRVVSASAKADILNIAIDAVLAELG